MCLMVDRYKRQFKDFIVWMNVGLTSKSYENQIKTYNVDDHALVLSTDQAPVEVLLLLCVPVVDPDKEDRNWRRPLNCLQLITAPLVCVFAFQSGICKCITFHDKGTSCYHNEIKYMAKYLIFLI